MLNGPSEVCESHMSKTYVSGSGISSNTTRRTLVELFMAVCGNEDADCEDETVSLGCVGRCCC